jgi:hypothetical protein
VVVQSWDAAGGIHKRGIYVNVKSEAVVVTKPAPESVVGNSVQVGATAGGPSTVSKMQLYVDGNAQFQSNGNTLNASVGLTSGSHTISVEASDAAGNLANDSLSITSAKPAVTILSPAANSSLYSPIFVSASTIDPTPVTAVQIYVDDQLVYQVSGTGVQATFPLSVGKHSIVIQEWNSSGATYKKGITVTVVPVPITISSPASNASVASPVKVRASAPGDSPVQTMQIYIDSALASSSSGQSVTQSFSLTSGQHYIVAKGWDDSGNNWYKGEYVTVR